jgi:hypothetical protein
MTITDEMAHAFATMLQAGLPSQEAASYFTESEDPGDLANVLHAFQKSRKVKQATLELMGGVAWQDMDLSARMRHALDIHYSQLAYLLHSQHYADLNATEKQKADTARTTLEAKIAGQAGKGTPLERFFADLENGKLKLAPTPLAFKAS